LPMAPVISNGVPGRVRMLVTNLPEPTCENIRLPTRGSRNVEAIKTIVMFVMSGTFWLRAWLSHPPKRPLNPL
jgi:hypothetical protein